MSTLSTGVLYMTNVFSVRYCSAPWHQESQKSHRRIRIPRYQTLSEVPRAAAPPTPQRQNSIGQLNLRLLEAPIPGLWAGASPVGALALNLRLNGCDPPG